MPVTAELRGAIGGACPPDVLALRHRLEMFRVHARLVHAQVVDDQAIGNGSDKFLVEVAVRVDVLARVAVAAAVDVAGEVPATTIGDHVLLEGVHPTRSAGRDLSHRSPSSRMMSGFEST